jgi:REP element-mobilizing transposase RayT
VPDAPRPSFGLLETATVESIARAPRIEVENGIYHVVARGNECKAIYRDAADRERFLEILRLTAERYCWLALAYCLMSNHYHLLVETPKANLAKGMRQLNGVYAQSFNRRHGRNGHLFQGRYGARLLQADEHLLGVVRYIVRNPLRAGLCAGLDDWPWSSHAATIGERPPGFLASARLLSFLGETPPSARASYLALVESEEKPPTPRHPLLEGDDSFVAFHLARLDPSPEYPRAYLAPPRRPLDELLVSAADAAAIANAHREHGYSMREIALHLGCGLTTVHRRIRSEERVRETE